MFCVLSHGSSVWKLQFQHLHFDEITSTKSNESATTSPFAILPFVWIYFSIEIFDWFRSLLFIILSKSTFQLKDPCAFNAIEKAIESIMSSVLLWWLRILITSISIPKWKFPRSKTWVDLNAYARTLQFHLWPPEELWRALHGSPYRCRLNEFYSTGYLKWRLQFNFNWVPKNFREFHFNSDLGNYRLNWNPLSPCCFYLKIHYITRTFLNKFHEMSIRKNSFFIFGPQFQLLDGEGSLFHFIRSPLKVMSIEKFTFCLQFASYSLTYSVISIRK